MRICRISCRLWINSRNPFYKLKNERKNAIINLKQEGAAECLKLSFTVLFFYFDKNTFVLLHHFRKKTIRTPRREIVKAKEERDDWISRKGRQQ